MRASRRRSGRPRAAALAALAVVAAVACRRIDPGPLDDAMISPGQEQFEREIYPTLRTKCGDSSCHGDGSFKRTPTRFVTSDSVYGYATATGFFALVGPYVPALAPILTRPGRDVHATIMYDEVERARIESWLLVELATRAGVPLSRAGNLALLAEGALARYRACMRREAFEVANMVTWAEVPAGADGTCATCHADGAGGFLATGNPTAFYDALAARSELLLQYVTVRPVDSEPYVDLNFEAIARVAAAADPHRMHPAFDPFADDAYGALQAFHQDVLGRVASGACSAVR